MTIEGTGVVFRGFVVRNSGRQVTEEAAGITVTGDGHRIAANDVHDVYFGVHVAGGTGHVVEDNTIAPVKSTGRGPGTDQSLARPRRPVEERIASRTPATVSI